MKYIFFYIFYLNTLDKFKILLLPKSEELPTKREAFFMVQTQGKRLECIQTVGKSTSYRMDPGATIL